MKNGFRKGSWQQLVSGDLVVGLGEWRERFAGAENSQIRVILGLFAWAAADFDLPVKEIDDPEFGDAVAGVGGELAAAVVFELAVGDLDDEEGLGGMRREEVARLALDDGDVGLGLGLVIEREGELNPNNVTAAKNGAE